MRVRERQHRAEVRGGFTLMEIMVVMMILVVLAGLAVPAYMRYLEDSRINTAFANCQTIASAAMAYKAEYGDFPASLAVLTQPTPDGKPPLLEAKALLDPWGREGYQYAPVGQHNALYGKPDVWVLDPSGRTIGNWQAKPGVG
jgi:general secretion pathway protein G